MSYCELIHSYYRWDTSTSTWVSDSSVSKIGLYNGENYLLKLTTQFSSYPKTVSNFHCCAWLRNRTAGQNIYWGSTMPSSPSSTQGTSFTYEEYAGFSVWEPYRFQTAQDSPIYIWIGNATGYCHPAVDMYYDTASVSFAYYYNESSQTYRQDILGGVHYSGSWHSNTTLRLGRDTSSTTYYGVELYVVPFKPLQSITISFSSGVISGIIGQYKQGNLPSSPGSASGTGNFTTAGGNLSFTIEPTGNDSVFSPYTNIPISIWANNASPSLAKTTLSNFSVVGTEPPPSWETLQPSIYTEVQQPGGSISQNYDIGDDTYRYRSPDGDRWRVAKNVITTGHENVVGRGNSDYNAAMIPVPAANFAASKLSVTAEYHRGDGGGVNLFRWAVSTTQLSTAYIANHTVAEITTTEDPGQIAHGTFTLPLEASETSVLTLDFPVNIPANTTAYLYWWGTSDSYGNFHIDRISSSVEITVALSAEPITEMDWVTITPYEYTNGAWVALTGNIMGG